MRAALSFLMIPERHLEEITNALEEGKSLWKDEHTDEEDKIALLKEHLDKIEETLAIQEQGLPDALQGPWDALMAECEAMLNEDEGEA